MYIYINIHLYMYCIYTVYILFIYYIYMYIYLYICVLIQQNLSKLTTSTYRQLPYIGQFIWIPSDRPYNSIVMIFQLPKPNTSLNGSFNVSPMADRFSEVLL